MPNLLIRDVEPEVVGRLKALAKRHRRSLQAEARRILERAALQDMEEAAFRAMQIRERFNGRQFADSAEIIGQDRER